MKKKNKTKKNKKLKKIFKKKGGNTISNKIPPKTNQTLSPLEISNINELKKLQEDREKTSKEQTTELMTDTSNIAKGLAINSVKGIGNLIGVDVTNSTEINKNLENIKNSLTNPKNTENIKKIISDFSEKNAIYLEAAKPLINPLMDSVNKVGAKVAKQFTDTSSTIVSNLVKEIPGVGLIYSGIQDASKIGDAFSSVVGATAELTAKGADSLVVAKHNMEKLKSQASAIKNRTNNSINAFENVNAPVIPKIPNMNTKSIINTSLKRGGTTYKNKIKHVRFNI